jgi:hypothetical protein
LRQVRLNLGGSMYDPTDPVGRLVFNVAWFSGAPGSAYDLAKRAAPRWPGEPRRERTTTMIRVPGPGALRDAVHRTLVQLAAGWHERSFSERHWLVRNIRKRRHAGRGLDRGIRSAAGVSDHVIPQV